jgi:pyruvate dehydrogenase E2 component (dihydrolipoamide acetyltransferase)
MVEFKLPDVGEGMHEAEIVRWLIAPGDKVKLDQPMLEIQTDKALVEIPSPVTGIVGSIRATVGQLAHVGDVLITFETEAKTTAQPAPAPVAVGNIVNLQPYLPATSRVRAAPAVRKRALELDVDLSLVEPGSPDGRVLLQDVLNYVEQRKHTPVVKPQNGAAKVPAIEKPIERPIEVPAFRADTYAATTPQAEERKPLVGLQRRMAERMELSWRTIPHVTTFDNADGEQLVNLRKQLLPYAESRGISLSYLPFIVKATVLALKQNPLFNCSLDDKTREIIFKHYYHIGLATATPDGLVVAVVKDADRLSLAQLATEINRLAEGARNRSLKPQELSGSTFTISNYGSYGGGMGTPIINPPEVAILGVGKLADAVVARDGQAVVRPTLPIALSFDHRVIDGAASGVFMRSLLDTLENPARLLLDMA